MNITFTCKDEKLARYYEKLFRPMFLVELEELPARYKGEGNGAEDILMDLWKSRMTHEAEIQEHYAYTTDSRGIRQVLYTDRGIPIILIPDIKIEW